MKSYIFLILGIGLGILLTKSTNFECIPTYLEPNNKTLLDIQDSDVASLWRGWYELEKNFSPHINVPLPTSKEKTALALSCIASSYKDPYTVFIPKVEANRFKERVNGVFYGIGVKLQTNGANIIVNDIQPNGSAQEAGILAGDSIESINGSSTKNISIESMINLIRGDENTNITMTVRRGNELITKNMKRKAISEEVAKTTNITNKIIQSIGAILPNTNISKENNVINSKNITENIPYFLISLNQFTSTSVEQFRKSIQTFKTSNKNTLIIDLRDNPGGYLDAGVEIASYFLPKDTLIVKEVRGNNIKEYKSYGLGNLELDKKKIIILVNSNTASAAEIVAAALRDNNRAILVGEKTVGKGSVQELFDIGDVGTLKITTAYWYTPSGINISQEGLIPDILVDSANSSSSDPILKRALEL